MVTNPMINQFILILHLENKYKEMRETVAVADIVYLYYDGSEVRVDALTF